ncbi:WGR domain-containing protein [Calothrix sp. NIES-4071]|nr:WGR domain-containing protein [Calothrix sp. NIES-4071]BAZ54856.1 WGR domain-containing protein [Calothrix sp. NIES-4105]
MQMFVTNYLDRITNPQHLRALVPYFITVLSSVNCRSGARKRIFNFLEKQAQKSEEAAIIIIEIMKRQSATMVTADKAIAIQIMLKIKKAYPHLQVPILVQDVIEERRKSIR